MRLSQGYNGGNGGDGGDRRPQKRGSDEFCHTYRGMAVSIFVFLWMIGFFCADMGRNQLRYVHFLEGTDLEGFGDVFWGTYEGEHGLLQALRDAIRVHPEQFLHDLWPGNADQRTLGRYRRMWSGKAQQTLLDVFVNHFNSLEMQGRARTLMRIYVDEFDAVGDRKDMARVSAAVGRFNGHSIRRYTNPRASAVHAAVPANASGPARNYTTESDSGDENGCGGAGSGDRDAGFAVQDYDDVYFSDEEDIDDDRWATRYVRKWAANKIQLFRRQLVAQRAAKRSAKLRSNSALRIQTLFRAHFARRSIERMLLRARERAAAGRSALRIQTLFRARVARRTHHRLRLARERVAQADAAMAAFLDLAYHQVRCIEQSVLHSRVMVGVVNATLCDVMDRAVDSAVNTAVDSAVAAQVLAAQLAAQTRAASRVQRSVRSFLARRRVPPATPPAAERPYTGSVSPGIDGSGVQMRIFFNRWGTYDTAVLNEDYVRPMQPARPSEGGAIDQALEGGAGGRSERPNRRNRQLSLLESFNAESARETELPRHRAPAFRNTMQGVRLMRNSQQGRQVELPTWTSSGLAVFGRAAGAPESTPIPHSDA